jgi:hypothetical protein
VAGNVSTATSNFTVTGDTTAPTANFGSATDNVGSVTGALSSGASTDDTTLVLAGSNAAGATVKIYNGSTLLRAATVSGTGWSYTATVANGTTYQFNAIETDVAGNVSAATSNFTVTGDTTAPTASFGSATDNVGSVTGALSSGASTDDTALVLAGSNAAGATVNIYNGITLLRAATVSGTGWSYEAAVADGTTYQFNAKETDVAGNVSAATSNFTVTGDTTAPTAANTSGEYEADTNTLVLTGTNYSTLLGTSESATTDIKARLDWTKLSLVINGDDATTDDVSFAPSDISSATVTDSTHLTIVLAGAKGTSLEATSGYAGATPDTLDITAGFAKDGAGNAATTDAVADGTLSFVAPYVSLAGNVTISLGSSYGNLIAPVQVEGLWYYYWDLSGDGTNADSGELNSESDRIEHDFLDEIFTKDINGVTGGGGNTSDTYRYATLNGVKLALPTFGGASVDGLTAGDNNSQVGIQAGTTFGSSSSSTTANGTYNDLLAIWDKYNGTSTATGAHGFSAMGWPVPPAYSSGVPDGWIGNSSQTSNSTWSATSHSQGHVGVHLGRGSSFGISDTAIYYVVLQVL